jgi:hypothetical protein
LHSATLLEVAEDAGLKKGTTTGARDFAFKCCQEILEHELEIW